MMEVLLAACCAGVSLVWREDYFDGTLNIVTDGDTAYMAGIASGVLVMDVRDPTSPALLGVCDMPGLAIDLHLSGSLLYVTAYNQGVVICDVRNSSSPAVVGSWLCPADECSCEAMAAQGTTLYVGDWENRAVYIVDAADLASPLLLGTYDVSQDVLDVKVSGTHLYVAHFRGMDVVDVTDPAAPALLGSYPVLGVECLLLSGDLVYLGVFEHVDNLQAVDVSDPTAITLVGSVEVGRGPFTSALRGTTLYVACESSGVYIVDVSNAASLSVLGTYGNSRTFGVATTGAVVLATSADATLQIIDASTPSAPTLMGAYGSYGTAEDVHATEGVAVVGDSRKEIRVFNISNPLAPVRLSTLGVDREVTNLFVVEHLVYVSMPNNLTVLSIADPSAPFVVGSTRISYLMKDLWVEGPTAYLVGNPGLHMYDVSDPSAPAAVGSYNSGTAESLVVVGTHAYVAADTSGLVIIDVSDRVNPVEVGSAVVPGAAHGVSVVGEVAYVAARSGGLQVLNVSNLMEPEIIGNYTLKDALYVQAVGDTAYVWDTSPVHVVVETGLRIFDVTDPTVPALVDTVATDGDVRDIYAVGTAVYVADHGLRVIDASPEVVPTPAEVPTPGAPVGDDDSPDVPSWVWVVVSLGVVGVIAGVVAAYFATRKKSVPKNDSAPDTA